MNLLSKNENLIWLVTAFLTVVIGTLYENDILIASMSAYWVLLALAYLVFGQGYDRPFFLILVILVCIQIAYFSFFGLALMVVEPLDKVVISVSLSKEAKVVLFQLTGALAAFLPALPLAIVARKTSGKFLPLFAILSVSVPFILGMYVYGIILMASMFLAILVTWWASPNKLSQQDAASGAAA